MFLEKLLLNLLKQNENIVGVTPAMLSGSSLNKMLDVMPDRVFDVGIAEQHGYFFYWFSNTRDDSIL